MAVVWSDAKPQRKKGDKGRITSGASFATVGSNKITVYRVKRDNKGAEVWHATINGKRIEKHYDTAAAAKADAEKGIQK